MKLLALIVYVRGYWRFRLNRWEWVRPHTRRWPHSLNWA